MRHFEDPLYTIFENAKHKQLLNKQLKNTFCAVTARKLVHFRSIINSVELRIGYSDEGFC